MRLLLYFSLVFPFSGYAQGPASPEFHPDGSITFRCRAPNAAEVKLRAQWSQDNLPLERASAKDAPWLLTLPAVPPGVWEYSFNIDGVTTLDSLNPAFKPQRQPQSSILHIPSDPPAPWDWRDVPHGVVHQHGYVSKALGKPRELWVYTPPGYDGDTAITYPLLVLQHGSGDNHRTWVEHGKAHWILDNLIASGKARPMIVLMLDGHPIGQVPRENAELRAKSLDAFRRELMDDALPLAESAYRIAPGRENRALAGLSMGGWQSINIGLGELDTFSWIASFSGAAEEATIREALDNPETTNARLRLLWIACGKDDFLLKRNETLVAALRKHGVQHEWQLTEGGHSWPVWRDYLALLAPRLFQPAN
jgi:enterochelin esterase-like enzyme